MINARGFRTLLQCCLFLIFSSVWSHVALGQRPEPPRLALDFSGPAGKTRALGFLDSGRRFFAAGENKVVQLYDLVGAEAVPGNVIRWEFARGAFGGINTVSVSRDNTRMVIAGTSARGRRGDVASVDLRLLSVDGFMRGAALIVASAISSDGSRVVSADVDGRVVLWNARQKNDSGTILQDAPRPKGNAVVQRTFNPVQLINDRFVLYFVPQSLPGGTFDGLVSYDMETETSTSLGEKFSSSGTGISSSGDGQVIIAGSYDGDISIRTQGIRSGATAYQIHSLLGDPNRLAYRIRNIVVAPDGKTFVVVGDSEARQPGSFLALFDTGTLTLTDKVEFQGRDSCSVAAFDGASSRLLSHDDSKEQLLVWQLKANNGQSVVRPLSGQNPVVVRGRGRIFQNAQFSTEQSRAETGYRVLLTDSQGRTSSISLGNGPLQEVDGSLELTNGPDSFAPGWTVEADAVSTDTIHQRLNLVPAGSGRNAFKPIVLNVKEQGAYSGAFTFIKDPTGKPFAAAIGTFKNDGIFLYRIPVENGGQPDLIRYFRDHNGLISCLSVSSDQKYLVSCSPDKTVKIWSLEGITRPPQESVFGAAIQLEADGKIHLREVIKAGILFARGLREGDVLSRVQTAAATAGGGVTSADEIEEVLSRHPAFGDLFLWAERTGTRYQPGGDDDRIRLTPGWEPLLTLVTDKTGEWVLFTPEGYFDASIVEGDRLFGWQINQGADKPPRFEPAEHLQKDFEKPDVIRQLLKIGNVPDALASLNQIVPNDLRASLGTKIKKLPAVSIVSPADGTVVANSRPLTLKSKVSFSDPADVERFQIEASQSGRLLGQASQMIRKGSEVELEWESQEIGAANEFTVVVKEKSAEISNSYLGKADVNVLGLGRKRNQNAKVYFLAFAVDKYLKEQSLNFSVQSVETFHDELSTRSGQSREFSPLSRKLVETAVTRSSVTATLNEVLALRKKSGSVDDLIIVAVCGHGISKSVTGAGESDSGDGAEEFFFLPHDVDPNDRKHLAEYGIRWKDMCDPINGVDCDVLWIVDACHSGRAFDEAKRAFAECRGTGGRHVIFAAQAAGIALERGSFKVKLSDAGNTALFMAIRETLIGSEVENDVNAAVKLLWKDGTLTFDELSGYSAKRTSQVSRKSQTIVFTPRAPGSQLKPLVLGDSSDSLLSN